MRRYGVKDASILAVVYHDDGKIDEVLLDPGANIDAMFAPGGTQCRGADPAGLRAAIYLMSRGATVDRPVRANDS